MQTELTKTFFEISRDISNELFEELDGSKFASLALRKHLKRVVGYILDKFGRQDVVFGRAIHFSFHNLNQPEGIWDRSSPEFLRSNDTPSRATFLKGFATYLLLIKTLGLETSLTSIVFRRLDQKRVLDLTANGGEANHFSIIPLSISTHYLNEALLLSLSSETRDMLMEQFNEVANLLGALVGSEINKCISDRYFFEIDNQVSIEEFSEHIMRNETIQKSLNILSGSVLNFAANLIENGGLFVPKESAFYQLSSDAKQRGQLVFILAANYLLLKYTSLTHHYFIPSRISRQNNNEVGYGGLLWMTRSEAHRDEIDMLYLFVQLIWARLGTMEASYKASIQEASALKLKLIPDWSHDMRRSLWVIIQNLQSPNVSKDIIVESVEEAESLFDSVDMLVKIWNLSSEGIQHEWKTKGDNSFIQLLLSQVYSIARQVYRDKYGNQVNLYIGRTPSLEECQNFYDSLRNDKTALLDGSNPVKAISHWNSHLNQVGINIGLEIEDQDFFVAPLLSRKSSLWFLLERIIRELLSNAFKHGRIARNDPNVITVELSRIGRAMKCLLRNRAKSIDSVIRPDIGKETLDTFVPKLGGRLLWKREGEEWITGFEIDLPPQWTRKDN